MNPDNCQTRKQSISGTNPHHACAVSWNTPLGGPTEENLTCERFEALQGVQGPDFDGVELGAREKIFIYNGQRQHRARVILQHLQHSQLPSHMASLTWLLLLPKDLCWLGPGHSYGAKFSQAQIQPSATGV